MGSRLLAAATDCFHDSCAATADDLVAALAQQPSDLTGLPVVLVGDATAADDADAHSCRSGAE